CIGGLLLLFRRFELSNWNSSNFELLLLLGRSLSLICELECFGGKHEEKSVRTKKKKIRDFPVTDEQKENYCNFLMEMFKLGVEGIIKQYQTYLKAYIPPNISHTAFDKNIKKNRYKDVICIDETRVVLQEGDSDYIHANHVKGDPFLNAFICTQGPTEITVNDFWIMIMQEKVSNIIMLCNVIEAGKNKCFQYWPQETGSSLTFGDVQIMCAEVNENKDTTFVLSTLEAENKNNRLIIKHLRWKDWPDKGVPSSVLAPFRILKIVRQSLNRTTVVHCSAGIGRTGCIVAIEMGLQQILSGKPLSLIEMVKRLRSMRMSAIQTDEQLVYVVRCLTAYADACGLLNSKPELQEKAEKFSDEYTAMLARKTTVSTVQKIILPETEPVERKKVVLPEVEPVEEQPAAKVEERQEEVSQKSIQEILEPNATGLKLDPSKMAPKQAQPLQTFGDEKQAQKIAQKNEPVPSPSTTPAVQKPQKAAEPIPSFFANHVQQPRKSAPPVLSPAVVAPVQQKKQTQSSIVPIQKPQKQALVAGKEDLKTSQKQTLMVQQQQQQSQIVQLSQQPGKLAHKVPQPKTTQLKPVPLITAQNKTPNYEPSNTKR
ncbi:unnamed protein product, partial [Onchocerca ochengi]|uniref:Tyrosine-protein phosphatase non-receptor type 2 n=1 Tax=Onchocerca ochengi TaxID=42157 RepID=A0A182EHV3_ONCOC